MGLAFYDLKLFINPCQSFRNLSRTGHCRPIRGNLLRLDCGVQHEINQFPLENFSYVTRHASIAKNTIATHTISFISASVVLSVKINYRRDGKALDIILPISYLILPRGARMNKMIQNNHQNANLLK
jgi:hypothetical protein